MSFFLYYFFHFLIGFGTLALFTYLIFKITRDSNVRTKLVSFLAFIILSNTPLGKYTTCIFGSKISSYYFRNCKGEHSIHITQFEHKWQSKQELLDDFEM